MVATRSTSAVSLLAELFPQGQAWGAVQFAIAVVIVLFLCGVVLIFARVSGVPIPQWVWHLIGLIVAAVLCIVAIRFVAGM